MINVGDVYYLSDQFGPKFIKIVQIGDIWKKDENWVFFYKSVYLHQVIKASYPENPCGCDTAQVKKWNLEKLLVKNTYNGYFKGCIKVDINSYDILNLSKPIKMPLPAYAAIELTSRGPVVVCKKISIEDFRDMKLKELLK